MRRKEKTIEELQGELWEAESSPWDGRCRLVKSSEDVESDGHAWGIVSDHGNVELCHKGRNGRIYSHGGLV